ncbi:MAG: hypothetical protein ABI868_07820 [Acidobacteriota bacterium]
MIELVAQERRVEVAMLDITSIGSWLEKNTARLHLFLPTSAPACALDLAEAFLQCWLRPVYEGKGQDAG